MKSNILTQAQIRVDGPFPIQYITGVEITSQMNDHSRIAVRGILWEEERDHCIVSKLENAPIAVYELDDSGEEIQLFSGIVTEPIVRHVGGLYYIEVEGFSHTYVMDSKLKSRSFQDKTALYTEVIDQVIADYPDTIFIHKPEDRPIEALILQYQETDWDFLKRLASHFNTVLIPDDSGDGPRFFVGLPQIKKELDHISAFKARSNAARFRLIESHGFDVREWDFVKYEVESSTRLAVGDCVEFRGHSCIVEHAVASFVDGGLFRYKYILGREKGSLQPILRNKDICGKSLLGRVLDTSGSCIKTHLRIDENQDIATAAWFPYAAQSNNLFYCMPEIGENISLNFPSNAESAAMATNAVRRNGCNNTHMTKPDNKRMAIPSGQNFCLAPPNVSFAHTDDTALTLDDGATFLSAGDINISGRSIKLIAQSVEMTAQKSLVLASGQGGELNLDEATDDVNAFSPGFVKYKAEGGMPVPSYSNSIAVNCPPPPPPEPSRWERFRENIGPVLVGLAAVAVVGAAIVLTGGLAAAAILAAKAVAGTTVAGVAVAGNLALVAGGMIAVGAVAGGINRGLEVWAAGGCRNAIIAGVFGGAVDGAISTSFMVLSLIPGVGTAGAVFFWSPFGQVSGTVFGRLAETSLGVLLGVEYTWENNPITDLTGYHFLWDVGIGLLFPVINVLFPPGVPRPPIPPSVAQGIWYVLREEGIRGVGERIPGWIAEAEFPDRPHEPAPWWSDSYAGDPSNWPDRICVCGRDFHCECLS